MHLMLHRGQYMQYSEDRYNTGKLCDLLPDKVQRQRLAFRESLDNHHTHLLVYPLTAIGICKEQAKGQMFVWQ